MPARWRSPSVLAYVDILARENHAIVTDYGQDPDRSNALNA